MRILIKIFFTVILLLPLLCSAENFSLHRSKQAFPEAMLSLQEAIADHGYTISRIQHVDKGLKKSGYETDKYRIVFFGKPEIINWLKHSEPALIPYLPLRVVIFAEGDETLLFSTSLKYSLPTTKDHDVEVVINQLDSDIAGIINQVD